LERGRELLPLELSEVGFSRDPSACLYKIGHYIILRSAMISVLGTLHTDAKDSRCRSYQ